MINIDKLSNYVKRFKQMSEQDVELNGYSFNYAKTIKKIDTYHANKFESGDFDSQGDKKYFLNILRPQAGNATKNIDLDSKDLQVYATEGSKDFLRSLIYNAELKTWIKGNKIGRLLNLTSEYLPIYGSVVWKKEGKTIKLVPLKNLYFDPSVSNAEKSFDIQSSYVIEEHKLQPSDVYKMSFPKEISDEMIAYYEEELSESGVGEIELYELYVELPAEIFGEGDGFNKYRVYLWECGEDYKYIEHKKIDSFPYKKLDYITVFGRSLGLGVYEIGFDQQMRYNEMTNQKSKSMKLSSKILLQTRDANVEGNILEDLLDGDIVKVRSEITRIPNEERNLAAYNQEENKILENIRSNTNAYEITTGANLPSGTSFRLGALQNENASKLFNFIRQNYGLFLDEVFTEWVLPFFEAEKVSEHIFSLYDREVLNAVIEADVNYRVNEAVKKYVIANGVAPSQEEIDFITDAEKNKMKGKKQFVKVVKDFLKFPKRVEFNTTGENNNNQGFVETATNLMQLLAQNPAIMQNPDLVKMLEVIADRTGIGSIMPNAPAIQPALNQTTQLTGMTPLAK